ncbi:MAG: hypothetical protein MKZ83_05635, partial [Candidatus Poseidoniia archaeon]|nr:hypothetical protein [Candidatus Poseidoniia archaeon]
MSTTIDYRKAYVTYNVTVTPVLDFVNRTFIHQSVDGPPNGRGVKASMPSPRKEGPSAKVPRI